MIYGFKKGQRLFHCIKEMTKIIKKLLFFMYIKVHWYNYVTGLVTRQILLDKYNSMMSHCEMYTKLSFFLLFLKLCKLSSHGLNASG